MYNMCNWTFYNYQLHASFLNKYAYVITLLIYCMIDMLSQRYSKIFPTLDNKRKYKKNLLYYMIFWYFLNHILLIVFIFYSYFIILILNKIIKISIIENYEHNPNIIK